MVSHLFFLRNSQSWIVFLAPLAIVVVGILGLGFISIFLTSSLLIFSTIFFIFSEHKLDQQITPRFEDVTKSQQEKEKKQEQVDMNLIQDSPNSAISESEEGVDDSLSTSDELDSEVDWPFGGRSPDFSDGSISDEDSLIEIALTSGQYVGHKEEEAAGLNKKIPDLFVDSILKQHNLFEFLATDFNEMNEEDNLIEIDISIGSIKCPRFEIEA